MFSPVLLFFFVWRFCLGLAAFHRFEAQKQKLWKLLRSGFLVDLYYQTSTSFDSISSALAFLKLPKWPFSMG